MAQTSAGDVGVFPPRISRPGDLPGDIDAAARHAEDLGLESVWAVVAPGQRLAEGPVTLVSRYQRPLP